SISKTCFDGIAGTVGEHDAVKAAFENVFRLTRTGEHGYLAAARDKLALDIGLAAVIDERHAELFLALCGHDIAFLAGSFLNGALYRIFFKRLFLRRRELGRRGDDAVHHAALAHYLGQMPRVDALNAYN